MTLQMSELPNPDSFPVKQVRDILGLRLRILSWTVVSPLSKRGTYILFRFADDVELIYKCYLFRKYAYYEKLQRLMEAGRPVEGAFHAVLDELFFD